MKYYFFLIFFFIFVNHICAQDSSKTENKKYKHGLEFQVGSFLTLDNFNSYTFSYRYRFNNNSGIRIGLYTNVNKDDYDIIQQVDSIYNNPPDYTNNYSFKISFQYLGSFLNYKSFSMIWGTGPFFSYSSSESNSENLGTSYLSKYKNKDKTIGYGLDLILGAEFKLIENVILSGEYGLTLSNANSDIDYSQEYIYNNGSPNRITKENGKRHTFSIRSMSVNLGLSVFL
jgi:hypothetical protein